MASMGRARRIPISCRGAVTAGALLLSSHCSLAFPVDDLAEGSASSSSAAATGTGGAAEIAMTASGSTAASTSSKAASSSSTMDLSATTSASSGSGGGFEPSTDGLVLHLDATGLPMGDRLAFWEDTSPGEDHAIQDDPTRQPHVIERDGLTAVDFDGMGQHLTLPSGFADFTNGLTLFAVAAFDDGGNCAQLLQLTNGDEIDDIALWRGGGFGFEIEDQWFEGSVPVASGAVVSYAVRQDALGAVLLTHNADLVGVDTFLLPDDVERTMNFVGTGLYPACASFHGIVHEILIYRRRLDDAEFGAVTAHLMEKWAVP